MSYYARLTKSPYLPHLSQQLHDHLNGELLIDTSVAYELPHIEVEATRYKNKERFVTKPSDVRLPARLASPLIPYPQEIKDLVEGKFEGDKNIFHGHHHSQITSMSTICNDAMNIPEVNCHTILFTMDALKRFARQSYSSRETLINLATLSFAKRATAHDLSLAAMNTVRFDIPPPSISQYTSFIIMIQRLRVHIAKNTTNPDYHSSILPTKSEEAEYTMFSNGTYVYRTTAGPEKFVLISCGGHFRIYHSNLKYWFSGPTSYLDYVFTLADILNNIDVLRNCEEYKWATSMFKVMIQFAQHEGYHNDQVNFMKGMEGFLLNMSDYDEDYAMNWKPILEAAEELWVLDQTISEIQYDFGLILALLRGKLFQYPKESYLCRMIIEGRKLSRTHLQEISALHKLIFYSEVNARAGVNKFLKRVHTPRKMDDNAVKNITRFAKMNFLISYRKRHKTLPNMIGPPQKVRLLEAYSQRKDFKQIESLNMSWWDDIKIFDCMDNTLTDDPLEFAKDKGALKKSISFGPGDSRKELLQVIEREDYKLKDFFRTKTIRPKNRSVKQTTQKEKPEEIPDPARLIEKEREQKYEARLFANAELENKHSLSLVAAKMKKALAYFDEQLMTPTDRKRKALIHEAARELSQNDNYSLLLDIEGHNQSMQHRNTAELCEFIGNLFGYDGWGDLGHYFSQLTVYHYDEYLDSVIESHGQLGGIEGWLNPLWTLHTTIMMKLLRHMTDITVKTIMVYSDDVNAILNIPQASEPMVKSVFAKIMSHCSKFGMTVKYSQTTLSKHRITMLRQHYADGIRADSTLKRLISVSAGNNPTLVSEEVEVAGICSSASSAMELSNHHEACAYLKNYKLGLLLCRLPQMILSRINPDSMISPEELPEKLSNLLYYSKDDQSALQIGSDERLFIAAKNDIASYLGRNPKQMNADLLQDALRATYGIGVAEMRLVDSPDRVLYLQVYDTFIQDLLFFWTYMPCSIGGLGASLHINLILSGHSIGLSKSLHYLHQWTANYATENQFFLRYLSVSLGVDMNKDLNLDESRLVTATWPGEIRICPATTSIQQSIKTMVRNHTKNKKVREMFVMSDDRSTLARHLVEIFRNNFHARIAQFYHENTSIHFIDLLISKIETSSGLLTKVRDIGRLRNSLCSRTIENIRMGANTARTQFFSLNQDSDVVTLLLTRKKVMFPKMKFVEVEEILYDDKLQEVNARESLITIRRCSPTHYRNGIRVYDDPKVGNETLYKGELMDDDRMLGNKEELLAAKLVAVTKWILMKHSLMSLEDERRQNLDVVKACNLSLSTLTRQTFEELFFYAPTETGGEILHRIPNIRFTTATYIRAEMNRSLHYTTELNQRMITLLGWVDSNINFDYLRMRLLVAAIVCDKYDSLRRLVVRYHFRKFTGIKDVQFVQPIETNYVVTEKFRCYSDLRGHTLSPMRFRYLSHSYLYEENMNEWALMPKLHETETAEQVGLNYINDIILRYSRDLDRDYMSISPQQIEKGIWAPLIAKLYKIDKNWKSVKENSDIEEIRDRLHNTLVERSRITTADRTNKVQLSLQASCLDAVADIAPDDVEFENLVARFRRITQNRRHSSRLSVRLAQYQAILCSYNQHRLNLAKSLILEYIITFHFKIVTCGGEVRVDVRSAIDEFMQENIGTFSLMLINPELQVRLMILGYEYVLSVAETNIDDITEMLREVSETTVLADIVMPSTLPSLPTMTSLHCIEDIPPHCMEIEYTHHEISYASMESLDDIFPLCRYARNCSTTGASPLAFTSPTGSDSLIAQLGLFKLLVNQNIIDKSMRILDLTAGRGDGLYAASHLGLKSTAFSREDTFTRILHHPDVIFKRDYDIFDGATLKFITDFDFVHVDISFSGNQDGNLLDLILFLEENNLPYSIRLNSVACSGYSLEKMSGIPNYAHFIAYAANSTLKPYQIYLIGIPDDSKDVWSGVTMKESLAFRSLALSYSRLLSPSHYSHRLQTYDTNSASIYMPKGPDLIEFIRMTCTQAIETEQKYYCERYISEVGETSLIQFVEHMLTDEGRELVSFRKDWFQTGIPLQYHEVRNQDLGNVSRKSLPHHQRHISQMALQSNNLLSISPLNCDDALLEYFRIHHPLQEVRTWCNISLGLLKFCRSAALSGWSALMDLFSTLKNNSPPKLSLHQREINIAIKLLVLSCRDDDYTFGVAYCHNLLKDKNKTSASTLRILRCYRLLSYLYSDIQQMMRRGTIRIMDIEAISHDLEIRELKKYKYKRSTQLSTTSTEDVETFRKIIDNSIDELFAGLETYALGILEEETNTGEGVQIIEGTSQVSMRFDIGIEDQVNFMIQKLNLQPSGPHGIIYLDDEVIPEFDDW